MSKEHAKAFIEQAQSNPEMRQKVADASEALQDLAQSAGFDFSHDDLRNAMDEKFAADEEDPHFCLICF